MTLLRPENPLLNARECAKILRISVPTFWRWVAKGNLPKPIKLGGLSRWPLSDLQIVLDRADAARISTERICKDLIE